MRDYLRNVRREAILAERNKVKHSPEYHQVSDAFIDEDRISNLRKAEKKEEDISEKIAPLQAKFAQLPADERETLVQELNERRERLVQLIGPHARSTKPRDALHQEGVSDDKLNLRDTLQGLDFLARKLGIDTEAA